MSCISKSVVKFSTRNSSSIRNVVFVIFFLFVSSVSAFAELKIGYIRPEYIFSKYEPYNEAIRKVKEFADAEEGKLQKESEEFKKKYEDYTKKQVLMSTETQEQTEQELLKQKEALDKAYDALYNTQTGSIARKQDDYMKPVIDDINEILTRIGENEGYDFILDAEQGGVLFANEKHDISDYILEEINKGVSSQ